MTYASWFTLLLAVSALTACGLACYAVSRRDVPGARAFALMLVGGFVWAAGYLRELQVPSLAAKLIWDNLQFIGVQLSGVGALCFALAYTGRGPLVARIRPLLWVEPSVTTLLIWTDPYHGLMRRDARIEDAFGVPQLVYGYGPWFWVSSLFNLGLALAALAVLSAYAARVGSRYRGRALAVAAGMAVPLAGAVLTISGRVPVSELRHVDLSPLTFTLANAIIAWALFRRRLLDVVPIARAQLIDQLVDAVIVVDAEGAVADSNSSARRFMLPRPGPVVGAPAGELWPALGELLRGDLADEHAVGLWADLGDEPRLLEGSVRAMRTYRGRLTGRLVVLRDVTEQHQAVALLREREYFISRINQTSPDLIYVYDLDEHRVIYCNRASTQLIGYGPELLQALGSAAIRTVIHADDRGRIAAHRARLLAASDEHVLSIEYRVLRADGRTRWLLGRDVIFARDEAGRPLQILGVAQDITVQREAAEAMQRAKEAAEAADRAKSAFLATMSHEIRTPLNAVIGMADLLLAAGLPDEQREYANTIRAGGQALLATINDVLDLSKIGAGRVELEARPFDLHRCLGDAAELVAHGAAAKGLLLRREIAPSAPRLVVGDETRLRQIVVNLLSNAVKFTERGEVLLAAAGAPREDGRVAVAIAVRDTGIGVAPEQREAIFEPFAQADSTTTRRYGGTGLGLAISRQLAELMGGTIELASAPGAGSTFTARLPLRAGAPAAAPAPPPLVAFRALVVAGSRPAREEAVALLQRQGGEAHGAATGGEALAWAAAGGRCDLALLGQDLSGLDAAATARALRGLPGRQGLPLLLLAEPGGGPAADERDLFTAVVNLRSPGDGLSAALAAALGAAGEGDGAGG